MIGAKVFRMNSGRGRFNQHLCPAGTPDLLAVGNFGSVWIEVKTPEGKIKPDQADMIQFLTDCSEFVTVARSLDDVIEFLHDLSV
jgi:hypothetical protein